MSVAFTLYPWTISYRGTGKRSIRDLDNYLDRRFEFPNYISSLPLLQHRPNVNLVRERRLWLRVQVPIRIRYLCSRRQLPHTQDYYAHCSRHLRGSYNTYTFSTNLSLWRHILQPLLGPRDINDPVNNSMRNMNTLWSEFASDALRERPHGVLGCREGGHEGVALDRGRCACEDESGWVLRRLVFGCL